MKNNSTQKNIPDNWQKELLGSLLLKEKGRLPKNLKMEILDENYMPYLTIKTIDGGVPMYASKDDGVIVNKDDLLVVADGSGSGRLYRGHTGLMSSTFFKISSIDKNKITNDFLSTVFSHLNFMRPEFRKGGAIPHFDYKRLDNINVFLPPINEQKKVVEIIVTVDEEIQKTDEIISTTAKLKTGLMHRLFTKGIGHTKFKKTEIGQIPKEWDVVSFKDVAHITNGQVDPKQEPYSSMVLLAPNHIESGSGRIIARVTTEDQQAISGKYLVEKGDVIYSKIRPYLQKVTIADEACLCSADMYPIKGLSNLDNRFLFHILLGDNFTRYAISNSGRTGIPKINREEIGSYKFALPPVGEQKKISEILSSIDEKVSVNQKLKTQLALLKKGLMRDLLDGDKRIKN